MRGVIEYHKQYSSHYPSGRIVTYRSLDAARRRADELNRRSAEPSNAPVRQADST
ncbi:hypothetical protein MTY66_60970 (plasmid) [Mycolicibacterium sp. TY66]|nr:hypothetical protein MTY66_60970 [Mycolicibacterium sp. TY66]BCJ84704.1 hypothetical protein MTY81_60770 [Mycolicibacterium sp. TY81]